jgi:hypothetical protein
LRGNRIATLIAKLARKGLTKFFSDDAGDDAEMSTTTHSINLLKEGIQHHG